MKIKLTLCFDFVYNIKGKIMAQEALYNKYRPKDFSEVVGQQHITKTLSNQVKSGNISHAYLFTGSRGTGKTSTARIFAKAINCLEPIDGSPCGKCSACQNIDSANVDIIEIDAASNNRVDEIREIRERVKFAPVNLKYKVYIIDEVHMLTDSAFNALLKTLEEPPKHVVFILGTTEVHKLPATILSRCIRFDFKLVSIQDLSNLLLKVFEKEKISATEEAIKLIANAGDGCVRDMLSIADCVSAFCANSTITADKVNDVLGGADNQKLLKYCQDLFEGKIGDCLIDINDFCMQGTNLLMLIKDLSVLIRNLLIVKTCPNYEQLVVASVDVLSQMEQLARVTSEEKLISAMRCFGGIEPQLRYALSPRNLLENASLEIITGQQKKN